ncbi:hypothetical protein PYW08_002832 [Mythimna loreyi]|uniref:Uncharacterized protein n=1 Tax=Mythimna loreyi TaxID=667449 RepID=A0ACC2QL20_9NEOP|nr:hypothetical protein PYW08_002832 [Mythimna loreyi]
MAALKKLLYYYNTRKSIKYGTNVLILLYFFAIIHIFFIRYKGDNIDPSQKYVLVWKRYHLIDVNQKHELLPNLGCRVNKCIFTEDKDLLGGDYTRFDAIIFTESFLKLGDKLKLPERRSPSQIYIFSTLESSYYYPACDVRYDDFFNWTNTHRLDSDVQWPYFVVRNASRHIVAPRQDVHWQVYNAKIPIPVAIRNIFRGRKKAAAWLVSHCNADNSRDDYMTRLQEHLYHFAIHIDVYGSCSNVRCTNDNCAEMLRKDYHFYMAFENSFSEDYVTEKVLHGYDNYVVPIVYGGANYTRFLPPGSYLNARKLHPYNLAYKMHEAIKDPEKYNDFFRWTNYYTLNSPETLPGLHPLCDLCEALHSERARRPRLLPQFRRWWNGRKGLQWCLPFQYWNETSVLRVDRRHLIDMY